MIKRIKRKVKEFLRIGFPCSKRHHHNWKYYKDLNNNHYRFCKKCKYLQYRTSILNNQKVWMYMVGYTKKGAKQDVEGYQE